MLKEFYPTENFNVFNELADNSVVHSHSVPISYILLRDQFSLRRFFFIFVCFWKLFIFPSLTKSRIRTPQVGNIVL